MDHGSVHPCHRRYPTLRDVIPAPAPGSGHIWPTAIDLLHPKRVVIENVRRLFPSMGSCGVAVQERTYAGVGESVQLFRGERDRSVISAGRDVTGDELHQVDGSEVGICDAQMTRLSDAA